MEYLFFTATIPEHVVEYAVSIPGLSHAVNIGGGRRQIAFFARNRREASRQIDRAGLGQVRDLSDGRRCDALMCDSIARAIAKI